MLSAEPLRGIGGSAWEAEVRLHQCESIGPLDVHRLAVHFMLSPPDSVFGIGAGAEREPQRLQRPDMR